MKKIALLFVICTAFIFSGCEKEEPLIPETPETPETYAFVDLSGDYAVEGFVGTTHTESYGCTLTLMPDSSYAISDYVFGQCNPCTGNYIHAPLFATVNGHIITVAPQQFVNEGVVRTFTGEGTLTDDGFILRVKMVIGQGTAPLESHGCFTKN